MPDQHHQYRNTAYPEFSTLYTALWARGMGGGVESGRLCNGPLLSVTPADDQVLKRCGDSDEESRIHLVGCVGWRVEERLEHLLDVLGGESEGWAALHGEDCVIALIPLRSFDQVRFDFEMPGSIRVWTASATL